MPETFARVLGDPALPQRFWEKVYPSAEGCWLWGGTDDGKDGYGIFYVGQELKRTRAHRVAFELLVGPIPRGLNVLHRCDVAACVNPLHLFLGTLGDNNRDRHTKGRDRKPGISCPHGHAYPENLRRNCYGVAYCLSCHRESCLLYTSPSP